MKSFKQFLEENFTFQKKIQVIPNWVNRLNFNSFEIFEILCELLYVEIIKKFDLYKLLITGFNIFVDFIFLN